jgi:methylphosphotriester-DNA--protein-cysteine methyltransferase
LTVERLASLGGLSPFHFIRSFRDATGLTPHQYVRSKRIERAKELLVTTPIPVTDTNPLRPVGPGAVTGPDAIGVRFLSARL